MADETSFSGIGRIIDDYELLRNGYYGTNGFTDGTYLFKHRRETTDQYLFRRSIAYYLNYLAPVINAHVDPVFRDPASRDWSGSAVLWKNFIEDVDGAGAEIADFMKATALQAEMMGCCLIVTDTASEQPATEAEVIAQRKFPYCYTVTPDRIKDFAVDARGVLQSVTYFLQAVDEKTGQQDKQRLNLLTWTTTGWLLADREGKEIRRGEHSLGRVPVTVLTGRKGRPGDIKPPSAYSAIARTNLHIYQLCSWLAEIHANQTFAVLTYPVVGNPPESLTIGTNNALSYNGEGNHEPGWIAPPSEPAESLQNQIDRLVQEIYRMANLTYVTGTKQQSSGVAKAWDFETTNQSLSDLAQNCERAEKDVAEVFSLWTGQALTYTCSYPRDFALADIAQEVADAQAVLDLNLGAEIKVEVAKKILDLYFDLEPKRYDEILEAIKADAEDAAQSMAAMRAGVEDGQTGSAGGQLDDGVPAGD